MCCRRVHREQNNRKHLSVRRLRQLFKYYRRVSIKEMYLAVTNCNWCMICYLLTHEGADPEYTKTVGSVFSSWDLCKRRPCMHLPRVCLINHCFDWSCLEYWWFVLNTTSKNQDTCLNLWLQCDFLYYYFSVIFIVLLALSCLLIKVTFELNWIVVILAFDSPAFEILLC